MLHRANGLWNVYNSQDLAKGKVFTECEEIINKNLVAVGFDEVILLESRGWSAQKNVQFDLVKEQTIFIPENMYNLKIGLGWDT